MAPLLLGFLWSITGLSLLVFSLRLFIKWKYRGKLWYDDYTLMVSMVFFLANVALVQKIVGLGFGRHLRELYHTAPGNPRWIVIYLQIISGVVRISTNLARVSFAITLLRLSNKKEKRFVWFAIITLLTVITPSVILPFVTCRPYEKIFDPSIPGTCIGNGVSVGYFYFEGAYTAVIDFSLVALPWRILSKLQMRRVEKLGASLAMSLGVLSGIFTIVKVVFTNQIIQPDWTYSSINLAIWNLVEPASVIIAASLPNLRVFIIKKTANLKASLGLGTKTMLGGRGRSQRTDDIDLERVQNTMNAISAGSGTRRGGATAWITSKPKNDDDSQKSILREAKGIPCSGIIQTSTFAIEYPEEAHSISTRYGR
ncbi:hypothetical protein F4777DRAFT_580684 [Nemania sp. FL0916]|nr:hypothetical protein F4777DRAFT_580684 [Nemania sp. FL0916]